MYTNRNTLFRNPATFTGKRLVAPIGSKEINNLSKLSLKLSSIGLTDSIFKAGDGRGISENWSRPLKDQSDYAFNGDP